MINGCFACSHILVLNETCEIVEKDLWKPNVYNFERWQPPPILCRQVMWPNQAGFPVNLHDKSSK